MSARATWPRGVPLVGRLMAFDRVRVTITVAGIGFAVLLMLFLAALYDGVRTEANGYVSSRPVEAWVAQEGTTNFIKSTSLLSAAEADVLAQVDGVREVSPLLRVITTARVGERQVTVILLGVDPRSATGRPEAAEGDMVPSAGEIVFDRALARQHGIHVGDTLVVQGRPFRVIGLSRGTNSVLTQFAVVTLEDAQLLLGMSDMASFFLVRGIEGLPPEALVARLAGQVPRTAAFTHADFSANNMRELRGGLLPILATVAVLGAVVGLAVLTLLLYGAVLEQREIYAVLKAIGAPQQVLVRLVLFQSLAAAGGGFLFGTLGYAVSAPLVVRVVPAMALSLSADALVAVGLATCLLGGLGAVLPLRRVRRVHPAELFRA